jgi:uncharacterized metal-binding protein YceD (DUF177 family)
MGNGSAMPDEQPHPSRLRVDALAQRRDTAFRYEPDAARRSALSDALGLSALRKLRLEGRISPRGRDGWQLEAMLGATVVQPCIVTLEPVTTRIDAPVERRYVPADRLDTDLQDGAETEMAQEDDLLEPLGPVIDLDALLEESLALSLPAYPRKDGASLGEAQFAADGVTPITDEEVKPFAGLAALRDKMQDNDTEH